MTTGAAEEHHLDFERQETAPQTTVQYIGSAATEHLRRLREEASRLTGALRESLGTTIDEGKRLLENLKTTRGPDPEWEQSDHDIADRVERIISRKYRPSITYANGDAGPPPTNGEKRLLSWILGVLALLLVGGVGSVVAMYGKLSSIEKGQEGHEQRINRLEADRDRYRSQSGAP